MDITEDFEKNIDIIIDNDPLSIHKEIINAIVDYNNKLNEQKRNIKEKTVDSQKFFGKVFETCKNIFLKIFKTGYSDTDPGDILQELISLKTTKIPDKTKTIFKYNFIYVKTIVECQLVTSDDFILFSKIVLFYILYDIENNTCDIT
jgi:hypothetical protein